eukprot:2908092-Pyramimonas_sp.AAC.1
MCLPSVTACCFKVALFARRGFHREDVDREDVPIGCRPRGCRPGFVMCWSEGVHPLASMLFSKAAPVKNPVPHVIAQILPASTATTVAAPGSRPMVCAGASASGSTYNSAYLCGIRHSTVAHSQKTTHWHKHVSAVGECDKALNVLAEHDQAIRGAADKLAFLQGH